MHTNKQDFPGGSDSKESGCNAGDSGLLPGLGRSHGEGNGYPLQYSCLENYTHREARQAEVHGVSKEWNMTDLLNSNVKDICVKRKKNC